VVRGGAVAVECGVEVVVVDEVEKGEARGDGGGVEVSWWGVSGALLASWYWVW